MVIEFLRIGRVPSLKLAITFIWLHKNILIFFFHNLDCRWDSVHIIQHLSSWSVENFIKNFKFIILQTVIQQSVLGSCSHAIFWSWQCEVVGSFDVVANKLALSILPYYGLLLEMNMLSFIAIYKVRQDFKRWPCTWKWSWSTSSQFWRNFIPSTKAVAWNPPMQPTYGRWWHCTKPFSPKCIGGGKRRRSWLNICKE